MSSKTEWLNAASVEEGGTTRDLLRSIDLVWRIESRRENGRFILDHHCTFPSGRVKQVPFSGQTGALHEDNFRLIERRIFKNLEAVLGVKTGNEEPLFGVEIVDAIRKTSHELSDRLVPSQIKTLFNEHGAAIETVLLVTEESGVPWELTLLGPKGRERPLSLIADVSRTWLGQEESLAGLLPVKSFLGAITSQSQGATALPAAELEAKTLGRLLGKFPQIDGQILEEPTFGDLVGRLVAQPPDMFHFAGHGRTSSDEPDQSTLVLRDRELVVSDLSREELRGMRPLRPFVFLNACQSGRQGPALTGVGGWPDRWMRVGGCGALLCPQWAINDEAAARFAETFYAQLQEAPKVGLGRALRITRQQLLEEDPEDPTPLAYVLYGHPNALVLFGKTRVEIDPAHRLRIETPGASSPLEVPEETWDPATSSPGALLRAEYGVVSFHFRKKELHEITEWTQEDHALGIRLYTGPGGIGKTRLAKEMCLGLREKNWLVGFLREDQEREAIHATLSSFPGPALVVVDYVESRGDLLAQMIRDILRGRRGKIRLLLLAREALDWWKELKSAGEGVGEFVAGPATERFRLRPLAPSEDERKQSYEVALKAFADRLERKLEQVHLPNDLAQDLYERVLMIHMRALAAMEEKDLRDDDGILDYMLARERRFWRRALNAKHLPATLVRGVSRAMTAITLAGGVESEGEALRFMEQLKAFQGQRGDVLLEVVHLLRDCYPGTVSRSGQWIEPVMPDLLGEHLIMRELEDNAEEILDLVLGPSEVKRPKI